MQKTASKIETVFGLKPSEYAPVAWSFVYFFCILSSYYMLRSVRETMATVVGVGNIPWLFSGTFIAMLVATPIFGWVASRYPRRKFLPWVYYFFVANILLFWVAFFISNDRSGEFVVINRQVAIAFFVWLSVFNLFVVSVFWSFMADIYDKAQSRRLFGLISAGGSIGAMVGPFVTSQISVPLGFENLLPISAAVLLFGVVCITQLRRWVEREHADDISTTAASDQLIGGNFLSGATAVLTTRYLLVIAVTSAIASLMGTALYMFMAGLVSDTFVNPDERTRIFALMDTATSLFAFIGQLFLVRHAVARLGMGITLLLLPLISLIGFALLAINPVFAVIAVLQVVRRGVGFGLSKPTNDMLYAVVPVAQKYKAKNFIDTALYRGGDLMGSWTINGLLFLGFTGIALVMLPFALIWGACAVWLGREYTRRDALSPRQISALESHADTATGKD